MQNTKICTDTKTLNGAVYPMALKGQFTQKWILSSFTHPHVISNMYDFLTSIFHLFLTISPQVNGIQNSMDNI